MSTQTQEWLALGIVGLAILASVRRMFWSKASSIIAQRLLKKGKVNWAMKFNRWSKNCSC